MLLTISTTRRPATDLGYLLHKSPDRVHAFAMNAGKAHVFYPEAREERCTAALLVEIDPVGLVRRPKGGNDAGLLRQYVNDRPYAASSFLSSAISEVFGTAMGGRSRERQDLADQPIPLEAHLPALPCRGGEAFLRAVFEPLGYEVRAEQLPLDPVREDWGASDYFSVTITAACRLRDLLTHLYVLIPVFDEQKHYWVGRDEIDKLLKKGEGWLERHPEREAITRRYLKGRHALVREALERLIEADGTLPAEEEAEPEESAEERLERPLSLNEQRLGSVMAVLEASGARRVLDLGCGEGQLLLRLARNLNIDAVLGIDVTYRAVASARRSLERLPERVRERVRVEQGSLLYRDDRLSGWDAAVLMEVIEHIEPGRLPALERNVFVDTRAAMVIVTTPNVEYNVRFPEMTPGASRHPDHRFEWTRAEFGTWVDRVASTHGYRSRLVPVGTNDPECGPPTQMAVFKRWS